MDLFADFSWWKLAWWAVGTLGVGGLIAVCAMYPAVLAVVVRFFRLVLSTRIGCAVVAAIVAALIADYWRHSVEDEKRKTENAAFEAAQVARDKRIKDETRALVWEEIANATAENAVIDKDVKDFTDALPKPPDTGNPFAIGADVCRLRKIYGQAGCGRERVQGMPKTDTAPASLRDRIRRRLPGAGSGGGGSDRQGQ